MRLAACLAVLVVSLAALAADAPGPASAWSAKDQPDLKQAIDQAKPLQVEDVGIPVKTTSRGELMRVPNPDGKTIDLLQWYYRSYPGPTTVAIIDVGTGQAKMGGIPDNLQIHICGRVVGPDGKLYIATPWAYRPPRRGMQLFVYDPATDELADRGVIAPDLDGENRPMCVGTDGKIYGTGTYPRLDQVGAYQIVTATGAVTDYGPIGPSLVPNGCWSKSIAADDRFIYITTAHYLRHLIAFDRETKTAKVLLTAENIDGDMSVRQLRYGCTASGVKIQGTDGERKEYWVYQGQAVLKKDANEPPPWKAPAEEKPWVVWPAGVEYFDGNARPKEDGSAEIWYRTDATRAEAPQTDGWRAARFQVPTYPLRVGHVLGLSDGRIFGNAGAYTGNFVYDPATGKAEHLGQIHLSQYSAIEFDGKVYMSGYPSSPLYIYDLKKPWTTNAWSRPGEKPVAEADENANPRRRIYLRDFAGTHEMVSAAAGADGKVYFGGIWIRDGSGGGLAWWDPKADKGGGMWKEFSNYRVNSIAAVDGGAFIAISTAPARDTTLGKPMPEQGKLFFFDTALGKIVGEVEPVPKGRGAGPIVGVAGGRVLGVTGDPGSPDAAILYGVEIASRNVAFRKSLPFRPAASDFRPGPDGKVWTYMGGALVRIDPADASIEVLGKLDRPGRLAFSGGDVYLSGSEQLRRVRGLYKP